MEKSESLFAALEHFLHNYKKVTPSERRSIRIAGALAFRRDCSLFFRLFGELNQDEQPARADQEHSVIDALSRAEEENPEMLREMWKKSLRSKGSRLFDGIKRAASWLKKAAGFLLDFLKRSKWFFKNLLRMAISSAHEYLHGVRLAVSKLPKAITWFCSRRITIEGVPNATIVKQGGFDLSVVHTGNIRSALTVAREYRKGVLDMLFGLRFIGLISTGLKTYSQVQIGNFYALTRTLIRHVSSIRQFRRWYQFEMERADRI